MKWVKAITTFCAAAIFSVALAGCAPTAKQEGTGGYIDDTVITTKVKSALLAEKSLKSTEISVETFKGRVQLSGFCFFICGCQPCSFRRKNGERRARC